MPFLQSFFTFIQTNKQLVEKGVAGCSPGLNLKDVRKTPIPLAPIEEQLEIVQRVESIFTKAEIIEQQYSSLKEKIDILPQAILSKAFKGELVEQLPTDGDAEELLEEIGRLKAKTGKAGKRKALTQKDTLSVAAEAKGRYGK